MKKTGVLVVALLLGVIGTAVGHDKHGPENWYWNTPTMQRQEQARQQAIAENVGDAILAAQFNKNVVFKFFYQQKKTGRVFVLGGNHFVSTPDTVQTKTQEGTCPVVQYSENTEEKTATFSIRQKCFDAFYNPIKSKHPTLESRDLVDTQTNEQTPTKGKCSHKHNGKDMVFTCKI